MTVKEIRKDVSEMKAFTRKIVASPKKSREFLINAGIYTTKGNLKKAYE